LDSAACSGWAVRGRRAFECDCVWRVGYLGRPWPIGSVGKRIEAIVGADIETAGGGQQVLEMVEAGHCTAGGRRRQIRLRRCRCERRATGCRPRPRGPDDRVRSAVGGRNHRQAATFQRPAPRGRERWRRAAGEPQHRQSILGARGAVGARALERDKHIAAHRIGGIGGADRKSRDGLGNQLAADSAEIVGIEQIGAPVFAERQDQPLRAATGRKLQRR
jgi:hypothetical protein